MVSIEKLVEKILNNPKDVRITDLVKFMEHFGFEYRIGSKGHYIFKKKEKRVTVAVDHPSPKVKQCYVDECIKIIKGAGDML